MKQRLTWVLVFVLFVTSLLPAGSTQALGPQGLPVLLGVYPGTGISELTAMNTWLTSNGARGISIAGTFLPLDDPASLTTTLNDDWNNSFVPFVNIMINSAAGCNSLGQIAAQAAACETTIANYAQAIKTWAGSTKYVYLAPFPEMNGVSGGCTWINYYGTDPASACANDYKLPNATEYINAVKRMRAIFAAQTVPATAVRWVFAPNGWSESATYNFENFYQSGALTLFDDVDVVAFSAFNFGGCPASYQKWDVYSGIFAPYLARMNTMAPTKPIFISQTATVGATVASDPNTPLANQTKSQWVTSNFGQLANYSGLRAILYFNYKKDEGFTSGPCQDVSPQTDWRLYYADQSQAHEQGLIDIMKDSRFGHWPAGNANWTNVAFMRDVPAGTGHFADMPLPLADRPNSEFYKDVLTIQLRGITGGCSVTPKNYCPGDAVPRDQLAVFLLRAKYGGGYTPPAIPVGGTSGFNDVAYNYWAAAWIKQLAAEGITGGCGGGNYCPSTLVTRDQMAVFLLRGKYGAGYNPPAVGGSTGFNDVPVGYWAAPWIKQLAAEGITSGCSGGSNYCPTSPVTRAMIAAMLVRTFGLTNP